MSKALVWLRRDLRLHDHAALHHALRSHQDVWLVFIFDTTILDPLLKKVWVLIAVLIFFGNVHVNLTKIFDLKEAAY